MTGAAEPRVSVLIPGYRTAFLRACLDSAVAQHWRDLEILVGDDCPHDGLRSIVDEYAARDGRVRRVDIDGRGGRANMLTLFAEARGELIKFLNDDDLLDERCVERMVHCLETHPRASLVTAHRALIDAAGRRLPDTAVNVRPVPRDAVLEAGPLIEEMLARRINLLGEPTSVMFRRADLAQSKPDIMSFGGRRAAANGDVSMWVSLLRGGDAIYLTETLSSFRIHDGQRQRDPVFAERGRRGWDQLCADALDAGLMPAPVPPGLRAHPLGVRPWWPDEARALAEVIERTAGTSPSDALLPLAERLEALIPDDPTAVTILATLRLEQGRAIEARSRLEPLVERLPWDVDARRALGVACAVLGDVDQAWIELCAALEAAPDDPATHAALVPLAATYERPRPPFRMLSGALDGPVDGVDVCDTFPIHGWVLVHPAALGAPVELELSIDRTPFDVEPLRTPRADVLEVHPQLAPFNPNPGFHVPLLTAGLSPGTHVVQCDVRCGNERLALGRARFNVLGHRAREVAG